LGIANLKEIARMAEFDRFVSKIRSILGPDRGLTDLSPQGMQELKDAFDLYKSDESEWSKYAISDPHKYTRNLVDDGNGKYNLLLLVWPPGIKS
jgi:hypothetical protein